MNGQMNEWMDVEGWKDGRIEGRMEGWTNRRKDGWMEGWMNRRMDE